MAHKKKRRDLLGRRKSARQGAPGGQKEASKKEKSHKKQPEGDRDQEKTGGPTKKLKTTKTTPQRKSCKKNLAPKGVQE